MLLLVILFFHATQYGDAILSRQSLIRRSTAALQTQLFSTNFDDPAIQKFQSSWKQAGIEATNVQHSNFNYDCGSVRGLTTVTKVQSGGTVISTPVQQCLVAIDNNPDSFTVREFERIWQRVKKGTNRLALLLLHEWNKGEQSPLHEYISILPEPGSLGTPIHWKEEILQEFPYKQTVLDVDRQRRSWQMLYSIVTELHPQGTDFASFERFLWAMEMVSSRAFQGEVLQSKDTETTCTSSTNIKATANDNAFRPWLVPVGGLTGVGLTAAAFNAALFDQTIAGLLLTAIVTVSVLPSVLQPRSSACVLLPVIDSCNHRGARPNCEIALVPLNGKFTMKAMRSIPNAEEVLIITIQKCSICNPTAV